MKRFTIPRVAHCSDGCRTRGGGRDSSPSPYFFYKNDLRKTYKGQSFVKLDKKNVLCKLSSCFRIVRN